MRDATLYSNMTKSDSDRYSGISVDKPAAGFYSIRLRSEAVRRGVRLVFGPPTDPITGEEMDRSWRWMAFLDDGSIIDFDDAWPKCAGDPISEADFDYYSSRTKWAAENAPQSAYANPKRRYDPLSNQEPLPF